MTRLCAESRSNCHATPPQYRALKTRAGEAVRQAVADEVKAGSSWSESYSRYMWENIEAGAKEAGRDPSEVHLVLGPLTSISADRDAAERYARRTLVFYLPYLYSARS